MQHVMGRVATRFHHLAGPAGVEHHHVTLVHCHILRGHGLGQHRKVDIDMTLTAPGCPVAGDMPGWMADAVEPLPGVKTVDVQLVWEPPWGMEMLSDEARLELGFI